MEADLIHENRKLHSSVVCYSSLDLALPINLHLKLFAPRPPCVALYPTSSHEFPFGYVTRIAVIESFFLFPNVTAFLPVVILPFDVSLFYARILLENTI